jgi:hypothetical protein
LPWYHFGNCVEKSRPLLSGKNLRSHDVGMHLQGNSGRLGGRILALESMQKEMEVTASEMAGQVSVVLASTAANTEALADLKGMFAKFFMSTNRSDDGNGSMSILAMEMQGDNRACSVEPGSDRLHAISPSLDPELFTESASEEDRSAKDAPPKNREEDLNKGTTAKVLVGSTKRATLKAQREEDR